jgi:hypothetical protein
MSENPKEKVVKNDPNLGNEFLLPPRLKALADVCGKPNYGSRYGMAGVLLKRKPATLAGVATGCDYEAVATDGRVLARVRGEFPELVEHYPEMPRHDLQGTDPVAEALIDARAWKESLGMAPKVGKYNAKPVLGNVLVRTYKDETTFAVTDLEKTRMVNQRNVEGRFPDYEPVIPDDKKFLAVDVDADYLIRLLKVAKEFAGKDSARVTLEVRRGRKSVKPLTVRARGRDEEFTGILMPLSSGEEV